jgi:tetratricopeptide (TPR) repeat protein
MLSTLKRLFRGNAALKAAATPAPLVQVDVNALLAQPIAALQEGRRDAALAMLEALTREHPESADAHLMLGTILHEQGHYEDARDSYLLAACFRPDWWPAHLQQGLLALDERRHEDAAASLRKAIELGADDARSGDERMLAGISSRFGDPGS